MKWGQTPLIVDTREQKPFPFKGLPVSRQKLTYGDYSLKGFENTVGIERKSLSDLWSTVSNTKNFDRFERELSGASLQIVDFWIVVESTPESVVAGNQYSLMNGFRLLDKVHGLAGKYGVHVTFGGTRRGAEIITLSILRAAVECL